MAVKELGGISVPARLGEVDKVRSRLRSVLRSLDVEDETAHRVELALHEILVNVVLHGYGEDRSGDMSVRMRTENSRFIMEIRDRGVPFDPTQAPAPDLAEKVRRGHRGGYGVYLFRTLMDGFRYRREGGENVLEIYKDLGRSETPSPGPADPREHG